MASNLLSSIQFLSLIAIISFVSCKTPETDKASFQGNKDAVALANTMFAAIGGKEKWCELRSLYIKAEHTEPQMTIPYQSEIWRAIDRFELVIEQQNDSFHVRGVFTPQEGQINYLDDRDTFRILSAEQLEDFEYDHNHNVYVLLNDLACDPPNYRVEIDPAGMLAFYRDTTFMSSFGLDDMNRPNMFYHPLKDGNIVGSIFTHWGTDDGLVHSAGGHPLDSNFIYRTEIWQPSTQTLEEAFGVKVR